MNDIQKIARVGYEAAMKSYAEMNPLPVELEALVNEPDWDQLEPQYKVHWIAITEAIIRQSTARD